MSDEQKKNWVMNAGVILSLIIAVASASSWAVSRSIGDKESALESRMDKVEAVVLQIPAISNSVDLLLTRQDKNAEEQKKDMAEVRQMFVAHIEKGSGK